MRTENFKIRAIPVPEGPAVDGPGQGHCGPRDTETTKVCHSFLGHCVIDCQVGPPTGGLLSVCSTKSQIPVVMFITVIKTLQGVLLQVPGLLELTLSLARIDSKNQSEQNLRSVCPMETHF